MVDTVMVAVHKNYKYTRERDGKTIHTTKHQEREGDPIQLVRVYDMTAAKKMVDDKIAKAMGNIEKTMDDKIAKAIAAFKIELGDAIKKL